MEVVQRGEDHAAAQAATGVADRDATKRCVERQCGLRRPGVTEPEAVRAWPEHRHVSNHARDRLAVREVLVACWKSGKRQRPAGPAIEIAWGPRAAFMERRGAQAAVQLTLTCAAATCVPLEVVPRLRS